MFFTTLTRVSLPTTSSPSLTAPVRRVAWGLIVGLLGLPLIQVVTVLFYEDTLSGGGGNGAFTAVTLEELGYSNVATVEGGFYGWVGAGLSVVPAGDRT